jgi:hypothetical protein
MKELDGMLLTGSTAITAGAITKAIGSITATVTPTAMKNTIAINRKAPSSPKRRWGFSRCYCASAGTVSSDPLKYLSRNLR